VKRKLRRGELREKRRCMLGRLREGFRGRDVCGQPSYRVIEKVHLCRMHWGRVREIVRTARLEAARRRMRLAA
jgi:hypothetical protein